MNIIRLAIQAFFKKINKNYYSQFGEDRIIINEILNPNYRNGFYIDWVLAENSTRGSTLARGGGTSSTVNDAIANTGTGGMGKYEQGTGMNGGSGIVVFRYPKELTITASSATVATATVGIYKITEVTASSGGTVRWD